MIADTKNKQNPIFYRSPVLGDDMDDLIFLDEMENLIYCSLGFKGQIILDITDKSKIPKTISQIATPGQAKYIIRSCD